MWATVLSGIERRFLTTFPERYSDTLLHLLAKKSRLTSGRYPWTKKYLTHLDSNVQMAWEIPTPFCIPVSWSWEDCGGNVSKQLAQDCYTVAIVAWPGCEPRTSQPEFQPINYYATEPSDTINIAQSQSQTICDVAGPTACWADDVITGTFVTARPVWWSRWQAPSPAWLTGWHKRRFIRQCCSIVIKLRHVAYDNLCITITVHDKLNV